MLKRWPFSTKLGAGLVLVTSALAVALASAGALREVVSRKDHIIEGAVPRLVNAERLRATTSKMAAESRAFLATADARDLEALRRARAEMRGVLETLRRQVDMEAGRQLVQAVDDAEVAHEWALQAVIAQRRRHSADAAGMVIERELRPTGEQLDFAVGQLIAREHEMLESQRQAAAEFERSATRSVLRLAALAVALAAVLALSLAHTTWGRILSVVRRGQVIRTMMQIADVRAGDVVYDLGCGDGRLVIEAAKLGARGVGVDIIPERVREARANVHAAGVEDCVEIRQGDLFQTDVRPASVVMLFLQPDLNLVLRPRLLAQLQPGARVISHWHDMGEWEPERTIFVAGRNIYLWTIPRQAQ